MDIARIQAISFDGLTDATGDASGLTPWFEKLVSPDEASRKDAVHAIRYRLLHQGTLADAAPRASQVLVDVALSKDVQDRHVILALLRWFVGSLPQNRADAMGLGKGDAPGEIAVATANELRKRASELGTLLSDSNGLVRGAAATLLSFLEEEAGGARRLAEALEARLAEESDDFAKAQELLALALASRRGGLSPSTAISRPMEAASAFVRVAAAVATLQVDDDPQRLALAAERSAIAAFVPAFDPDELPWASGDPGRLVVEALLFAARKLGASGTNSPWSEFVVSAIRSVRRIIDVRLRHRDVELSRVTPAEVMMAEMAGDPPLVAHEPDPELLQYAYSLPDLATAILELGFGPPTGEVRAKRDLRPEQLELLAYCATQARLPVHYAKFGLPPSNALIAELLAD